MACCIHCHAVVYLERLAAHITACTRRTRGRKRSAT
jgi:hypothetical protein